MELSWIWELASKAGLKVQVIHVPATFPAENVGPGHMISGLGVPDMRGRVGTPTYYTSDPTFQPGAGTNEFSLELVRLTDHRESENDPLRARRRSRDGEALQCS